MKTANWTDTGRVRLVNEDRSFVEACVSGFGFAVVADGMGGHLAGEVASQMTTNIAAACGQLRAKHMESVTG